MAHRERVGPGAGTVTEMTAHASVDRLLLLYTDRSDPVARILLEQTPRFGREIVALSLAELLVEVAVDTRWRWRHHVVDPARTAVINRLSVSNAGELPSYFDERQLWTWLRGELGRFAYASSVPSATSMIGDFGSLRDQWLDLPERVPGLPVPTHAVPGAVRSLDGDVYRVDPWRLYSLGTARAQEPDAADGGRLTYVRPPGRLLHVAQVGGMLMPAAVPEGMTAAHRSFLVSFVRTMASTSDARILEHAFFIGPALPVFYSTCPVPVITGSLPDFPELLVQGLLDDIDRRRATPAA